MSEWANVKYPINIPGDGMFVVGMDVAPGRYVCEEPGDDGYWVRFPQGGVGPVIVRHAGGRPAEVVIENGDNAFDSHVAGEWTRVPTTRPAVAAPATARVKTKTVAIRPVVDPDLPGDVVKRLTANPALLDHVRHGTPWTMRAEVQDPVWILPLIWVAVAFTLGVWLRFIGPAAITLPFVLVFGVRGITRRSRSSDLRRLYRTAVQYADRCRVEPDFDAEAAQLMRRAQRAIRKIKKSTVAGLGLLDPAEDAIVLPRQEWEIAKALSRVSELRREQAEMLAQDVAEEVRKAIEPLRHSLDTVVASVTQRVQALERYAAKVREADLAYKAHEHLRTLAARTGAYQELLAETVRDDIAVVEIERLARNAESLRLALTESLAEARRAGDALTQL
ncbi:hypothetical protein J5X84_06455 [Streptosporangiaceae bacterium NEAU-GS5]|nr:hypothetical protein [Streptosporangiaceae bacterium NEAU-GS5]